jgi:hypothetical protein
MSAIQSGLQASSLPSRPVPQRSRFYVVIALITAAIVFGGFARTFFLNAFLAHGYLGTLRIVHGTVFSLWLVLLLAQTTLVARNRTDIHRRLGIFGFVLAVLMIVLGLAMAFNAAKYGFHGPGLPPPLIFVAVPFFDIVVFATLIAAAFYYRRKPEIHKRLIIVATISILPPALARFCLLSPTLMKTLPFSVFLVADLMIVACVLYDYSKTKRLQRAWLWGGLLFFVSFPLRMLIASTTAWQSFARWVIS